ncbi:MAG: HAMP domain-containing sensor histidine kinase [Acidobacteriota bacterium]
MSLRLRLVLLILFLVAIVAVALSALQLRTLVDSLSESADSSAELAGHQVTTFLINHISKRSLDYHPPEPIEDTNSSSTSSVSNADPHATGTHAQSTKTDASPDIPPVAATQLDVTRAMWIDIVSHDPEVEDYLRQTLALFHTVVEINVADEAGVILASSNPTTVGVRLEHRQTFTSWGQLPWYRRGYDLVSHRPDWEVTPRPIGFADSTAPAGSEQDRALLQVQVVSSSVIVRDELWPQVKQIGLVSAGAILVSLLLTLIATNRVLRPLKTIEQTIDRISQGFRVEDTSGPLAKEFRAVESKLLLLGQQFHEAKVEPTPPKTLEGFVEHVASQLDVATRLAAISRLSGGVAHEIKNPLNAILLRLDLLRARIGDTDDEVTKEFEILSKEVLRLDRVVKTFLDFTRPVEVHFEELDLAMLVREVADFIRPQAASAKITLECVTPDGPCLMRGDPDLLKQAALNLVTNAVEAMSNTGGMLRLSVRRLSGKLILEVVDDGPGIPVNVRNKVFQLYFTTKSRGSGIGLAMTYRAVQLHNGTVSFSSGNAGGESGRGTIFHLEFPAQERDA